MHCASWELLSFKRTNKVVENDRLALTSLGLLEAGGWGGFWVWWVVKTIVYRGRWSSSGWHRSIGTSQLRWSEVSGFRGCRVWLVCDKDVLQKTVMFGPWGRGSLSKIVYAHWMHSQKLASGFDSHSTVGNLQIPTMTKQYCVRYCENSQINGHGTVPVVFLNHHLEIMLECSHLFHMILAVQKKFLHSLIFL